MDVVPTLECVMVPYPKDMIWYGDFYFPRVL